MTPSDIKRLREVAETATPGEWVKWSDCNRREGHRPEIHARLIGDPLICVGRHEGIGPDYRPDVDMAHIATFNPTTVLALLDVVERYETALEEIAQHQGTLDSSGCYYIARTALQEEPK